ncbi:MAG: hypothetical protein M0R66_05420 [Candidatus Omnitrophica bacterium]|nr:hypothetical protein [Candidatus Omnitrophota bacterium]
MLNVYGDHVSISGELRVDGATHLSALAVGGDAEITGDVSTDGSITAGEPITAASTAASTSPATGALVVAGGAGIGGDLYIGGAIHGNLAIARGSITSTWMGFEIPGLSTQTIYYRKNYGVATLCTLDRFEGVKDADGFPIKWFPGLLGQVVLPAEFRPADTSISTIVVSEGGEMKIASVTVLTDGRIIIRRADWSAWTPGASIVINPWCISYAVPE